MTTRTLTATTALLTSLALLGPVPLSAQTSILSPGREAGSLTRMPICPGGGEAVCAEGTPLTFAEALELLTEQGDTGAIAQMLAGTGTAICPDGSEATCPDGGAAVFDAEAEVADEEEAEVEAEVEADVETEVEAEIEAEAEAEVEAEAGVESEAEAEIETEAEVETAPEAEAEIETEIETDIQTEAEAETEAETEAEVETEAEIAPVLDAEEATAFDEEARRVIESLLTLGRPEAGDGGGPLTALLAEDRDAAVTETVETEVTAEESRQSDEEFETDPAGRPTERRRSRDAERLALLGLGALAVGAILSSGDQVVANTGDRVVLRRGTDDFYVLRDDDAILRRPGSLVRTERFDDGSTRTFITRADGSVIITVRDASGRVVLREREDVDGRRIVLIDDTVVYEPVVIRTLPPPERRLVTLDRIDDAAALRAALDRATAPGLDRSFSLRQVRDIPEVRKLVPEIAIEPITFQTASSAIRASEAQSLADLGFVMSRMIADDPREMFLIEGHTDAVGGAAYNLALSDRRAESVALALTEYFDIPPENMVVQGYGFTDLAIPTAEAEERNRRVAVRRITPLLTQHVALR